MNTTPSPAKASHLQQAGIQGMILTIVSNGIALVDGISISRLKRRDLVRAKHHSEHTSADDHTPSSYTPSPEETLPETPLFCWSGPTGTQVVRRQHAALLHCTAPQSGSCKLGSSRGTCTASVGETYCTQHSSKPNMGPSHTLPASLYSPHANKKNDPKG